jgi:hypothetical protein
MCEASRLVACGWPSARLILFGVGAPLSPTPMQGRGHGSLLTKIGPTRSAGVATWWRVACGADRLLVVRAASEPASFSAWSRYWLSFMPGTGTRTSRRITRAGNPISDVVGPPMRCCAACRCTTARLPIPNGKDRPCHGPWAAGSRPATAARTNKRRCENIGDRDQRPHDSQHAKQPRPALTGAHHAHRQQSTPPVAEVLVCFGRAGNQEATLYSIHDAPRVTRATP